MANFPQNITVIFDKKSFNFKFMCSFLETLPKDFKIRLMSRDLFTQSRKIRKLIETYKDLIFELIVDPLHFTAYWDSWIYPHELGMVYNVDPCFRDEINKFIRDNSGTTINTYVDERDIDSDTDLYVDLINKQFYRNLNGKKFNLDVKSIHEMLIKI